MTRERESWVTRDYGGEGKALTLSRSPLGEFMYHLLRMGGEVTSTYALNPSYERSYLQFSITLPAGRKEEFEKVSGFALEKPPHLHPAGGFSLS